MLRISGGIVVAEINKEAIISDFQAGAHRGIPEISCAAFIFWSIRRSNIGVSRKLIFGIFQLLCVAIMRRLCAHIDAAVHPFHVIGYAAVCIIDWDRSLD